MNARGVNDSSETISSRLISLLVSDVVLLPCEKGIKGPRGNSWQNTTIEKLRDQRYIRELECAGGIAVLRGLASGGLCSIDSDDDNSVEPFLALNPDLAANSRRRRGRGNGNASGGRTGG